MRQPVNVIQELLDECSDQDRSGWKSHAQTILGAIHRSHTTRRALRTAIATAFFDSVVIPEGEKAGWQRASPPPQEAAFSVAVENDGCVARVLITGLQLEGGVPRRAPGTDAATGWYFVHMPKRPHKTRSRRAKNSSEDPIAPELGWSGAYSAADFDILAVAMYPVTRVWSDFRFALSASLLRSEDHPPLIAPVQQAPVGETPHWTADFLRCLDWHRSATRRGQE